MPLVEAKCTKCGAALTVDDSKEAMVCQYCGEAFIVEKAINNYNITNNIQAGVVNVYGEASDFEIKAGELIEYKGASVNVTIPNTVRIIGPNAFRKLNIESVSIPNSVTRIGNSAFMYCSNLTSITIPDSVTSISDHAFFCCTSLTSITITDSVTSIGDWAFSYTSLKSITIPNSVTSIGESAFWGCTSLTSITIPNSVTSIGRSAFYKCTSLTSITIPNSVTSIGDGAFSDCKNLTSITIPDSVTSIGKNILSGCPIKLKPTKKEGCYIATAVYGSYDAPEVMTLRRFRDNTLKKSFFGRLFIKVYYTLSPPIAKKLKNAHKINGFVRRILDRWVDKLNRK